MTTDESDKAIHEVLRQMPYGLYVVGIADPDGNSNALVASWVTQCSFKPRLVMVGVRNPSSSYDIIKGARAFSLNLLDQSEIELVKELEKPYARDENKLSHVAHVTGTTGAPVLEKSYASVECEVREILEPGDHALVVAEVVSGSLKGEGAPLMASDLGWKYGG